MRRRNFLRALAGGSILSWLGLKPNNTHAAAPTFEHGIASGDPLSDRVILWTRVSGYVEESVDVRWRIAGDPDMRSVLNRGEVRTGPEQDYTVKVDATRLPENSTLYYQFEIDGTTSPTGRTRTLPTGTLDTARFAVVSCANYPYGYFHVYREIAKCDDIDAVIHLGDYIYEYGMGEYATERAEELQRVPEPRHEAYTLADLRKRHAQYKTDADSQAMHAAHPLIAIWDDHELGNDAWRNGSNNHQPEEGQWPERRDAAIRAYLEWMPIRARHERGQTRLFRDFRYGDLLTLIMLDTRLYGRDVQADANPEATRGDIESAMGDPERRLLGRRQEAWLRGRLAAAEATTWQIIGQQVMVSPTLSPSLEPLLDLDRKSLIARETLEQYVETSRDNPPMLLDTWNGYPSARQDFLEDLYEYAHNPVVLSGDLHTSMAGNLSPAGHDKPAAVEFMTGSVASPGFAEYLPEVRQGAVRDATLELNPTLSYMETDRRGWLLLEVSHDTCRGEWHLVDTVHERHYASSVDKCLFVESGNVGAGLQDG